MKLKSQFSKIFIFLLSVLCFTMFAIVNGVAMLGFSQNIDNYKEKLEPWIFSAVEFSISYGIILMAVLVVLTVVSMLSDERKIKVVKP